MRSISALVLSAALSGCAVHAVRDEAPAPESAPVMGDAVRSDGLRQELLLRSLALVGVDYKYGGTSPMTGFDCSGLVHYLFAEVLGVAMPRTAREMSHVGDAVPRGKLRPGDLVFFNTLREPYSHVGIYLGGERFIHAPATGGQVEIVTLTNRYWRAHYDGARRIGF